MEFDILAKLDEVDFAPANVYLEVAQNVKTILTTLKYSVPLDRNFGLNAVMLDKPMPRARLTDEVLVLPPESVSYEVHAKFFIDKAKISQASGVKAKIEAAYEDFKIWQKSKLGRDINPSELNFRLVNAGAKRVEVYAPEFRNLKPWEVAIIDEQGSELIYGGLEDG